MPQLRLEYTSNVPHQLDFDALFAELHRTLADSGSLPIAACKSRATRLDDYFVGDGHSDVAFVHLEVRFFAGRSDELKQEIAAALMKVLRKHYAPSEAGPGIQFTLEIRDVHQPTYLKVV